MAAVPTEDKHCARCGTRRDKGFRYYIAAVAFCDLCYPQAKGDSGGKVREAPPHCRVIAP